LLVVVASQAGACGWDDEVKPSTQPRGRSVTPTTAEPAEATEEPEPSEEDRALEQLRERRRRREAAEARARQEAAEQAASADEDDEGPERDYSGELRRAMGGAAGCLQPRPAEGAPDSIRISLEAVVLDSGRITRGYVRSGQLKEGELDCLQQKLRNARLKAGVEQAPRTVTSSLEMKFEKKPKDAP
jgi:hypothetical protein